MAKGKKVPDSMVEMVEFVLPNDANALGSMLGGKVMHLIDIAGAMAAQRHSRSYVATASVDQLDFLHPIRIGQMVLLKAVVTRAFRTSMEVEVQVFVEDVLTGERRQTSSAYLTFVALDQEGRPKQVPPLLLTTRKERLQYQEALLRRRARLRLRRRHEAILGKATTRNKK